MDAQSVTWWQNFIFLFFELYNIFILAIFIFYFKWLLNIFVFYSRVVFSFQINHLSLFKGFQDNVSTKIRKPYRAPQYRYYSKIRLQCTILLIKFPGADVIIKFRVAYPAKLCWNKTIRLFVASCVTSFTQFQHSTAMALSKFVYDIESRLKLCYDSFQCTDWLL